MPKKIADGLTKAQRYYRRHKDEPEFKEKQKACRDKYKVEASEGHRLWNLNNRKHVSEYNRQYRLNNVDKIKSYKSEHYIENREREIAISRQWAINHPVEVNLRNRARAAKVSAAKIVKEEISNWNTRICGICNFSIKGSFHVDHIIPLSRGGLHEVDNLQLTHPHCNLTKHNKILVRR